MACHLDGPLVGLGPADGEERPGQVPGRDLGQLGGQAGRRRVGEAAGGRVVLQRLELPRHRLADLRPPMAHVHHRQAGKGIQVAAARRVPHVHALAAHDHLLRRVETRRAERVVGPQVLRLPHQRLYVARRQGRLPLHSSLSPDRSGEILNREDAETARKIPWRPWRLGGSSGEGCSVTGGHFTGRTCWASGRPRGSERHRGSRPSARSRGGATRSCRRCTPPRRRPGCLG